MIFFSVAALLIILGLWLGVDLEQVGRALLWVLDTLTKYGVLHFP